MADVAEAQASGAIALHLCATGTKMDRVLPPMADCIVMFLRTGFLVSCLYGADSVVEVRRLPHLEIVDRRKFPHLPLNVFMYNGLPCVTCMPGGFFRFVRPGTSVQNIVPSSSSRMNVLQLSWAPNRRHLLAICSSAESERFRIWDTQLSVAVFESPVVHKYCMSVVERPSDGCLIVGTARGCFVVDPSTRKIVEGARFGDGRSDRYMTSGALILRDGRYCCADYYGRCLWLLPDANNVSRGTARRISCTPCGGFYTIAQLPSGELCIPNVAGASFAIIALPSLQNDSDSEAEVLRTYTDERAKKGVSTQVFPHWDPKWMLLNNTIEL